VAGKHIDDEFEPPGGTFDAGDSDFPINTFLGRLRRSGIAVLRIA
jgi:hypothetical protein